MIPASLAAGPVPGTLTRAEVAALFGVDPGTVSRWAAERKILSVRTPGGQRRYPSAQFADQIAFARAGGAA